MGKGGPFLKREQLTDEKLEQIHALNDLALRRGQTLSQMALSWVLANDAVTSVLIGASSPEQIVQNLGVLNAPAFTAEDLRRIEAITLAKG
jgi:L-glyceraldehyde 3-phosphate reductase